MRKSDLTGAIASVNSKDMKQGVITSTEQLLQGKVAGLSIVQSSGAVESGASIRLRGGTSLSASNGPLVVVDGIPGVDINSVQPQRLSAWIFLRTPLLRLSMVLVVQMVLSSSLPIVKAQTLR